MTESGDSLFTETDASIGERYRFLCADLWRLASYTYRRLMWEARRHVQDRITIRTDQGKFTISSSDFGVARLLYCMREFELDLIGRVCREFVHGGPKRRPVGTGTLLDVGANIGVIGIGMLSRGLMNNVVAVEPEPENFKLLLKNVADNGLTGRVRCLPFAASDREGIVELELSDSNFGDHYIKGARQFCLGQPKFGELYREAIKVDAIPLDLLVGRCDAAIRNDLALMWIDVQGYEGYVFQGAQEILGRGIPVVCEIWPYGIERAGMSLTEFCDIAKEFWASYSVLRGNRFVTYPISCLNALFVELGPDNHRRYTNIVLHA